MKCFQHNANDATATCHDCGVGLCNECALRYREMLCDRCAAKYRKQYRKTSQWDIFIFMAISVAAMLMWSQFEVKKNTHLPMLEWVLLGFYIGGVWYGWVATRGMFSRFFSNYLIDIRLLIPMFFIRLIISGTIGIYCSVYYIWRFFYERMKMKSEDDKVKNVMSTNEAP